MKKALALNKNEDGFVLITALLLLAILTVIGLAATTTTTTEMKIASNDRAYRSSFYAAEAGLAYVTVHPELYGSANVDLSTPQTTSLNPSEQMAFDASIQYLGVSSTGNSLRGSGFSAGKFRAHNYEITTAGTGAGSAQSRVMVEGYRVGF